MPALSSSLSFWISKDTMLYISRQKRPITHKKKTNKQTQADFRLLNGNTEAQETVQPYLEASREWKHVFQEPDTQPKCFQT